MTMIHEQDFFKLAASIPNKEAVDAILSLGFLKKETLSIFTQNIDYLKYVESMLAQLLIIARLGEETIDETAVETAMKSVNETIEALESGEAEKNILQSVRSERDERKL